MGLSKKDRTPDRKDLEMFFVNASVEDICRRVDDEGGELDAEVRRLAELIAEWIPTKELRKEIERLKADEGTDGDDEEAE